MFLTKGKESPAEATLTLAGVFQLRQPLADGGTKNHTQPFEAHGLGRETMGDRLEGLRVLIVEDDPIIALDVAYHLRGAGADVIGPAYNLAHAARLIEASAIDAAVLDYRLETETATPVAYRLTALGVPFLFHTSSRGQPELEHPGVPIVDKPTRPGQLVAAIKP